jgi:ATP-dependent Clp protease protease subunit
MARFEKEWVDAYFDRGVDVVNRRLFLVGDVEQDNIGDLIKGIYLMEHNDKDKPITLFINTYGGFVYEAFGLYDTLQTVNCPIEAVAVGKVMSAGVLLVASGFKGKRYGTENCVFMYHGEQIQEDVQKPLSSHKKDVRHYDWMEKRYNELMAKHTKKNYDFWKRLGDKNGDTYFDADKAIEYGIIDQIWNEKEGE